MFRATIIDPIQLKEMTQETLECPYLHLHRIILRIVLVHLLELFLVLLIPDIPNPQGQNS